MAGISISIEGKAYDLDDFELGELEWIEDHIGAPLSDEQVLTSMKALVAFVYIIKHREDETFTIEQARKIKLSTLEDRSDGAPKKRPTKAAPAS
jgi:hypothetical protein